MPQFLIVGRLNVIVAIQQNARGAGYFCTVHKHAGMTRGGNDLNRHIELGTPKFGEMLGALHHFVRAFRIDGHGGHTQDFEKFLKEVVAMSLSGDIILDIV